MPRKKRFDKQGYYFHIISRGQRKNPIFFSYKDMEIYLKTIKEIKNDHDIAFYSYCLMRNHVHFLVKRNLNSLHNFMQRLNTKYALFFNRKYDLVGHVFQNRYKSKIVLNNNYLRHLVKYIHNNPVKAGIVLNEDQYIYSSAKYYLENNVKTPFPVKKIGQFSKIQEYKSFVDSNTVDKFPVYKDSVGLEIDYLNFISDNEEMGLKTEIESSERIFMDAQKFLLSFGIGLQFMIHQKHNRKLKNLRINLIKHLIRKGHKKNKIANLLNYHKTSINKILERK